MANTGTRLFEIFKSMRFGVSFTLERGFEKKKSIILVWVRIGVHEITPPRKRKCLNVNAGNQFLECHLNKLNKIC